MQRKMYELIPTTLLTEDKEEGKYTTLYTDVWNFEILLPLEELKGQLDKWGFFKYRKLEESSKVIQHYWELVLDLDKVKILWFKEHHIIDDRKLQREIEQAWQDLEVND